MFTSLPFPKWGIFHIVVVHSVLLSASPTAAQPGFSWPWASFFLRSVLYPLQELSPALSFYISTIASRLLNSCLRCETPRPRARQTMRLAFRPSRLRCSDSITSRKQLRNLPLLSANDAASSSQSQHLMTIVHYTAARKERARIQINTGDKRRINCFKKGQTRARSKSQGIRR